MKLGKLPARKGAVTFELTTYATLPKAPRTYGHTKLVTDWAMLGNDAVGDCVFAGAAHETMLWNKEANKAVSFTDTSVLSDYSAVTGYTPSDPSTDQGTDMQVAASYRRKTGVIDASGNRHKVGAYLAIKSGDIEQLKQAIYLFGAVGVGIEFPATAMEQFNKGKTWSVVRNAPIDGGHYIPLIGYSAGLFYLVTWGKVQKATVGFIRRYMDEGIVYLSEESLTNGKNMQGFDLATLQKDIAQLH